MEGTVYLKEVLEQMRKLDTNGRAVRFDISVRTFNRQTKKGGKLKVYNNVKLVMNEKGVDRDSIYALQNFKNGTAVRDRKNPRHFQNKTRNIRLESGEVKKIHINYIIEFNGKKVVY